MARVQALLQRTFGFVPEWVIGLGLVCLAIVCALFVHRIVVALAKRAIGLRRSIAIPILDATTGPTRLAVCLAAVAFVLLRLDVEENFLARKHVTQVRVFKRVIDTLIIVVAVSTALMTFDSVRQYGVSLFASAGAAGLVVGLAARPLLSNLIAGVQIAITQPIRIEDAVIIEDEWGWVEDIASTYVVIRLWDWRRMVVPLAYFIERPFQNWTRDAASLIGSIILHVDYAADVPRIRKRLEQAVKESKLWDGAIVNLQVVDTNARTMELRALVSARNAPQAWDLRCEIREKLVAFLQKDMREALPRERADISPPLTVYDDVPLRPAEAGSSH